MKHFLTFCNILAFLFDLFFAVLNHDSTTTASSTLPPVGPGKCDDTEEFFFYGRSSL